MKRLLLALLALLLPVGPLVTPPAAPPPADPYRSAGPSTLLIEGFGPDGHWRIKGTGFVVAAGGGRVVATAAHVLADPQARYAVRVAGRWLPVTRTASDGGDDLAVLGVAGVLPPALPLAPDDPAPGAAVEALGFPLTEEGLFESRGVVSGYRPAARAAEGITAAIFPGNSGGPVLDAQGRVCGVVDCIEVSPAGGGLGFAVAATRLSSALPALLDALDARPVRG